MRTVAAVASFFAIAGCAIHPLPQDVSAISTAAVVQRIRCEARAAILYELDKYVHDEISRGYDDAQTLSFYAALQKRQFDKQQLDYDRLPKELSKNVSKFAQAAIAYNFTFDITEKNGASAGIDGLALVSGGVVNVGGQVGGSLSRQNIRSFTVADRFEKLIRETREDACKDRPDGGNFTYPITGKIGVDEMIETFVALSTFQHLGGPPTDAKGPPTMADTLVFTTSVSGSIAPKVTLAPVRRGIADAGFSASGSRDDVHKVIIGLSLPDLDAPKTQAEPAVRGKPRGAFVGALITAAGTNAEINAALAIQQQIFRFDLRGATIVLDGNNAIVR